MFSREVLLYAEDDMSFAEMMAHNLRQGGFEHRLIHVPDGEQALDYLKGKGIYADRQTYPLPAVALLDLKMPRYNGFEVLQWIRKHSDFPQLPVVVLTVSEELRDINLAYQLGANSFLIKPPKVAELREMLQLIDNYWFKHNSSGNFNQERSA